MECHTMTALRDIVVVLDDSASSEMRLTVAVVLPATRRPPHRLLGDGPTAACEACRAAPRQSAGGYAACIPIDELGCLLPHDYLEADTQVAEAVEQMEAPILGKRQMRPPARAAGRWQAAKSARRWGAARHAGQDTRRGRPGPLATTGRAVEHVLTISRKAVIWALHRAQRFGTKIPVMVECQPRGGASDERRNSSSR